MKKSETESQTITAIATPQGFGGIGILRLSGPDAYSIALKLSRRQHDIPSRQVIYGQFYPVNTSDALPLDSGIWIYFKAPHSFTGEDVIEFQGHGSPVILDELLRQAIDCGARLASPGEFSLRAFLNEKLDLAQAEAICDLIHAHSVNSARLAMRSLQGEFSQSITHINTALLQLRIQIEAAIDFSDEDIVLNGIQAITQSFNDIHAQLKVLCEGAQQGALLRQSSVVVIAGPPNAGKSTLLNALSREDVAIVDDEAGTTRDIMKSHVLIDDIPVELIDTAGIRDSQNRIEQEGIRRAEEAIKRADAVIVMHDISTRIANQTQSSISSFDLDDAIQSMLPVDVPVIQVFNKVDHYTSLNESDWDGILISAKNKLGLDAVEEAIKKAMSHQPSDGLFLARRRHLDALKRALHYMSHAEHILFSSNQSELLAEDLKCAHHALSEILGEFTADDLLGEIFSSFCIGK